MSKYKDAFDALNAGDKFKRKILDNLLKRDKMTVKKENTAKRSFWNGKGFIASVCSAAAVMLFLAILIPVLVFGGNKDISGGGENPSAGRTPEFVSVTLSKNAPQEAMSRVAFSRLANQDGNSQGENENQQGGKKGGEEQEFSEPQSYPAIVGESIYVTINLNNPDGFEILSVTLNGRKYQSFEFVWGSTGQKIILMYDAGNVPGTFTLTVNEIKCIEGTQIKIDKSEKSAIIGSNNTVSINVRQLFTLKFGSKGGSIVDNIFVADGETAAKPDTSREGYTFKGWYVSQTEFNEQTLFDFSAPVTASAQLWADWTPDTYQISFNMQAEEAAPDGISVTFGSEYGILPLVSRTGYVFGGWMTGESGTPISGSTVVKTPSDHILYAEWTPEIYTVSFDSRGGAEVNEDLTVAFDGAYGNLPQVLRAGYFFDGWRTEESGGTPVTAVTVMKTASDHTLYAKWVEKVHTVVFDANGGIGAPPQVRVLYGSAMPDIIAEPQRSGYVFTGFFDTVSGGKKYYNDDLSGASVWDKDENSVSAAWYLYAGWELNDYSSGSGAEENPYVIKTKAQLKHFADCVNGGEHYAGVYFELGADINLGGEQWTPIGKNETLYFAGIFDGKEYSVTNFQTASARYMGLFGYNCGTVRNLKVEGFIFEVIISANMTGYAYAGGLAAFNGITGEIENCYAGGVISIQYSLTEIYAGGLAGQNEGRIIFCTSVVMLSSENVTYSGMGGLAGNNEGSVLKSYAFDDVSAAGYNNSGSRAGGLLGRNGTSGSVEECMAFGNVTAVITGSVSNSGQALAGGLIGRNYGQVINCAASGKVTASTAGGNGSAACAGGLIGNNEGGSVIGSYASGKAEAYAKNYNDGSYAGGLTGYSSGIITNCYAAGDVYAESTGGNAYSHAGGLAGVSVGTIINCYASGDIWAWSEHGTAYAGGLAGRAAGSIINSFATGNVSSISYYPEAGGLAGSLAGGLSVENCFRYSEQSIYVEQGGYPVGTKNSFGESAVNNLGDEELFYRDILCWCGDIWDYSGTDFSGGVYPVLIW